MSRPSPAPGRWRGAARRRRRAAVLAALALAGLLAGCQTHTSGSVALDGRAHRGEFPIPNYPNPDGES